MVKVFSKFNLVERSRQENSTRNLNKVEWEYISFLAKYEIFDRSDSFQISNDIDISFIKVLYFNIHRILFWSSVVVQILKM